MKISQCCFVGVLGDAIALSQWPSLASKFDFMDPTVLCAYPFECDDNVPPRITRMYLFYRGLSGTLPISIGLLSNLQYLYLSDNTLSGIIPDSLGQLSNLYYLDLSSNYLVGVIPASLSISASLSELDLGSNFLTGNVPSFVNSSLSQLNIGSNIFSGALSVDFLKDSVNLQVVDLSDNLLTVLEMYLLMCRLDP